MSGVVFLVAILIAICVYLALRGFMPAFGLLLIILIVAESL